MSFIFIFDYELTGLSGMIREYRMSSSLNTLSMYCCCAINISILRLQTRCRPGQLDIIARIFQHSLCSQSRGSIVKSYDAIALEF